MSHQSAQDADDFLLRDECYRIQGAVFEVSRRMGCGFLESVYQECLEREFVRLEVPYESQKDIRLYYREELLQQSFRADFVCFGSVIVEIKAVKEIAPEHQAQILNYLKASRIRVGLLVNFGKYPKPTVDRFIL